MDSRTWFFNYAEAWRRRKASVGEEINRYSLIGCMRIRKEEPTTSDKSKLTTIGI